MPSPPRRPGREPVPAPAEYYTPMWRSPIMLIAVGAFVVLAVVGYFLYQSVERRNMEKQFAAAVKDAGENQFAKAVKRFDKFLEDYPESPMVDSAIVWRGVARVRQYADGSTPSWPAAMDETPKLIEESKGKRPFRERGKEIAELVVRIASGLALLAKQEADPALLERANNALGIVESNFDADARPTEKMDEARGLMKQATREIEKSAYRKAAIARMDKAIESKDAMTVFVEHEKLYQKYADLRDNADAKNRLEKAREIERTAMRFESAPDSPALAFTPGDLGWAVVRRQASSGAKVSGKAIAALVADVLYAVDTGNGEVRWRSPVGYEPAFPPTPLAGASERVLVHRTSDDSLLLLSSADGKEVWRRSLGAFDLRSGSKPAFLRDRIYLVANLAASPRSGRLLEIDAATGSIVGQYIFPQPLIASPVIDAERRAVLVAGEQVSLYTVLPDERKCGQVIALDHARDAIRCPPLVAGRFLFVAEAQSLDRSILRCLVLSNSDGAVKQRQTESVPGLVWTPPAVRGGRLFLTTDARYFAAFELGGEDDAKPLAELFRSPDAAKARGDQDYPVATSDNDFWTVGSRLRLFEAKLKSTQITPMWERDLAGAPTQPPLFVDGLLIIATRQPDSGAISVQAVDPSARDFRWQTELGLRPDLIRLAPGSVAVRSRGELLATPVADLAASKLIERPVPQPSATSERQVPLAAVKGWTEGSVLWTSQGEGRLYYDPPTGERRRIKLTSGPAAEPIALGKGVLFAGKDGMVYWVDPKTSAELAEPFAGPFVDGRPIGLSAVAPAPGEAALVIAGASLLKIAPSTDRFSHLRETGRLEIGNRSAPQLVAIGDKVMLISGRDLVMIDPAAMKLGAKTELSAPVRLRPAVADKKLLLVTASHSLVAVEPTGDGINVLWTAPLGSPPLEPPLVVGDDAVVSDASGRVRAFRLTDGARRWEKSVGRALAAGAIKAEDRLILIAADGSLVPLDLTAKNEGR